MDDPLTYGAWVRRRRRELDLTQAELAHRVSCARTTIEKLEADARRPSKVMAERLADALLLAPGTRPDFLSGARSGWMNKETTVLPIDAAPGDQARRFGRRPVPLTPLIGRASEVAAVCTALEQTAVRVLTLTGAGGIGKTRLALQVAAELEPVFTDGVVFVDLAPIRDPALVPTTIADALGILDSPGYPLLARLQAVLGHQQMLLLLDNFEQVVAAAPVVSELLTTAPRLKVLLTSRTIAGVYGEHDFPVPPLPLPVLSEVSDLDRLMQVETVRIFVERARAARPDFRLTNENARAVSTICHQLEGLPLSIELAAARMRLLSPHLLLQHFDEGMSGRLKVLTGGPRTVPQRQQTVRATIAWSYDLLDAREQQLFRRLGVFVGGCTLEAAEVVCGWEDRGQVQTSLEALLDTSLLQQRERVEREVRMTLLETIREYALEQLVASGELEQVQRRHADYFVSLAERTEPVTTGPGRLSWWSRLEAEHDNLRTALAWSRSEASGRYLLRLAVALIPFWTHRGHTNEGYGWLAAAVRPRELDDTDESSSSNDQRLRADALDELATFALFLGIRDGAQAWYEESLALFQNLGDRAGQHEVLGDLGMLFALRGDFDQSHMVLNEGLALARDRGDASTVAKSLFFLGNLAYAQGQSGRAGELWEEGLLLLHPTEDPMQRASHLLQLSIVALDQGDLGRARAQMMASLTILHDLGDRWFSIHALEVGARLAAEEGCGSEGDQRDLLVAAHLFGAAEACREHLTVPGLSLERRSYEHGLATLRAHLDAPTLGAAWAEGQAMTLEQAIAYALEHTTDT